MCCVAPPWDRGASGGSLLGPGRSQDRPLRPGTERSQVTCCSAWGVLVLFLFVFFCFLNTPGGRRARRAASILVFARSEKFCLSRDVYGTKAREGPWPPHYFVWFFGPPGRKNAPEGCRARRAALCFSSPWAVKTPLGTTLFLSLSLSLFFFLSFFGLAPQPARVCARGRPLSPGPRSGFRHLPHSGFAGGRWAVFVPSLSLSLSLSLSKHTIGTHKRRRAQHCFCSFCSSLLPLGFPLSTAR